MNHRTDQELLREFAESRAEAAFAELVRRHIDFVHSAARRMVRDAQLAEDVTQAVFVALAGNARQLVGRPVLAGWLHRTARNHAANIVRTEVRRRAHEQEAVAMNELLATPAEPGWERIAPLLDDALGELNEPDRDALFLRYFERKSAREMALLLGVSDETAQKRVSRAVEKLREYFTQRGVTVGASGLVVALSANAVQAAPVGLALSISSSAVAGTTLGSAATATTAKAIAMNTLQKTLVAATITVLAGAGLYEARQAAQARAQVASLRAEHAPMAEQFGLLQRERDEAARQLALLQGQNADLKRDLADLPRLRGEVTRLRTVAVEVARSNQRGATNDAIETALRAWVDKTKELGAALEAQPGLVIPEFELLGTQDWLNAAMDLDTDEPDGLQEAANTLRRLARDRFATRTGPALHAYLAANDDLLPAEVAQLKPYFDRPVTDEMLQRYRMTQQGKHSALPPSTMVLTEIAPVDNDRSRIEVGVNGWHHSNWPHWPPAEKSTANPPAP